MTGTTERPSRPAIIQYWHAEQPPAYIDELLTTFQVDNPDMGHLVFNEQTATDLIAERLGVRHVKAFQSCAVPAMQADYFRYCAVYALGGVYVDADFASCRSLRPLLAAEGQLFEQPSGPVLNGVFAFRSPHHPLLALAIEVATRNIEGRISDNIGLVAGPGVFTSLVQLHRQRPLSALLRMVRSEWRADADACWGDFTASIEGALATQGPIEPAFAGVRISPRAEMLQWVDRSKADLPYKEDADYWANWKGSVFRPPPEMG